MTTTVEKTSIRTWAEFEDACEDRIPGYQRRPAQGRLAETIETLFAENGHGSLQAGTGTGKSFAYLVPAILNSLAGNRTLVATATKVLQSQLVDHDLPLLTKLLSEITGRAITYGNLKGRSNYICRAKLADAHAGKNDITNLAGIEQVLLDDPEHDGDIAHFTGDVLTSPDARAATISAEECPGRAACPFGTTCFAYAAKDRAKDANIVVTNHAMLALDVATKIEVIDEETEEPTGELRSVLLPEYDTVVVDEAHRFEEFLTSMLGASLTPRSIETLVAEANAVCERTDLGQVAVGRLNVVFEWLGRQVKGNETTARLSEDTAEELVPFLASVRQDLLDIATAIGQLPRAKDSQESARKARLTSRVNSMLNKLAVLNPRIAPGPAGEVVRWVQREEREFRGKRETRVTVGYSPLRVDGFLRERLWPEANGLLLSATLRPGGQKDFIPRQLGLDQVTYFDAGTPFDYPAQAGLFVADKLNPKTDPSGWTNGGHDITMKAIEAADGRALLLFTSRREMKNRFATLKGEIEDAGYNCYMQQEGVPVDELIRIKKSDPTSVIFALKSLMEGVDIQGDALRLVILDKLPFTPPGDVIFDARCDAINAEVAKAKGIRPDQVKPWEGAFSKLSVPTMALLLEQAFGRLIRTVTDRGAVVVLDNRLSPRKDRETDKFIAPQYGRTVFKTLPPARDLRTVKELRAYLEEIAA